jgi:hypothetical protein
MANMEFLTQNYLNTTTMLVLNSNTDGAQYLFDRNKTVSYTTSGYNSTTASTVSIQLTNTTSGVVLSNVIIQNHNLRSFRVFYNSVTANSLLVSTTNSATSTYISFASITVSSIQLQMDNTIAGSVEKSVGEFIVANRKLTFERNPSINDFKPVIDRKQVLHEMPDGGVVTYNIKNKYRATLAWDFITSAFYNQLLSVYEEAQPLYFLPEPTATGWNGSVNEVLWVGDFDFNYSTNDKVQGYGGKISLRETPSR